MRKTAWNKNQLDVVIKQIQYEFNDSKGLNIEWSKPSKPVTLKQMGFFWGGLIDSVYEHFRSLGHDDITEDDCKWLLYTKSSPKINILGSMEKRYMTISDMNREQMADFIDRCIDNIDNDPMFEGLILHPSLRYCWVNNITMDDLKNIDYSKIKRIDKEYLSFVRGQSCLVCGIANESEAHHLKELGMSGVGYKADDAYSVPLCREHHEEYHQLGKDLFEKKINYILKVLPLETFCAISYLRWLNKN